MGQSGLQQHSFFPVVLQLFHKLTPLLPLLGSMASQGAVCILKRGNHSFKTRNGTSHRQSVPVWAGVIGRRTFSDFPRISTFARVARGTQAT